MASITGNPTLNTNSVGLYATTTQVPSAYSVGQLVYGANGKAFRLALVGASNLVMGNMLQSSAVDTQFTNMAVPTATAAGSYTIDITNGTTTVSANQFDGGSMSVYTAGTVAIGDEYTIISHTTGGSGATITLTLDQPLRAAFTTSAKVNMRRSPWSGVIQSPATTLTGTPAGVAMWAATAAQYTWVQTKGVGAVLSDGSSILVGSPLAVPSGTAGAVILGATNLTPVGYAMQAAAAPHAIGAQLQID